MRNRVLIVDDEPRVLAGIQRILLEQPYQILTARSGREALSIIEKKPIDVIVADQDMPGMNGIELLTKVHLHHPAAVRIMLTGNATVEVAIEAINKGAITRLLTKPCDPDELVLTIHQALIQKDLKDEAGQFVSIENKRTIALGDIERKNPGITHVNLDAHGAIELEEQTAGLTPDSPKPNET